MDYQVFRRRLIILILASVLSSFFSIERGSLPESARAQIPGPFIVYLPFVVKNFPGTQPFGVESHAPFTNPTILGSANELNSGWTRLGIRVSWRMLQPNQGDPIDWAALEDFETELRLLRQTGINPVVIVYDSPYWAVVNARTDGQLTSCAAIAENKFGEFAAFISQLAARYSESQFGVRDWEIGNEIDIDPDLVAIDNGFGCWGDLDDVYYGGRHYGKMLKVVTPAIRAANPDSRIWLGGLLVDRPDSVPPPGKVGRSELFLEGVLLAGAAPYFDVLPYHWYPSYYRYYPCTTCGWERIDYDIHASGYGNGSWYSLGGGVIGKAAFLKSILNKYGVKKQLSLNEIALGCMSQYFNGCEPQPTEEFLQAQADFVTRTAFRTLSAGVSSYAWFTLNDTGWRSVGLLDSGNEPKPVYYAYQTAIRMHDQGIYKGTVAYGAGVEAYAIDRRDSILHVVWTAVDDRRTIKIPASSLMAIYDRDGNEVVKPRAVGGYYYVNVSFSPMYFVLKP